MLRSELLRDPAGLFPDVHGDGLPGAASAGHLQALEPHAPLPEDGDRIADSDLRSLHRRDAVTERLQAGRFMI